MTQDYRNELIKQVHAFAEKAKVGVRKIRQHARDAVKKGKFADDDAHAIEKEVCTHTSLVNPSQIQRITDELIKSVDAVAVVKEKELKT